ncbi:hypothetical protein KSP40_PGU019028 [Platanthera guangdongensis]|uniref:C2 domain-containing protein n=1 Tax=Platanthera guangdongensis TaxID=2320717 RepID=A0ABR2MLT0_9ASPA
MKVVVEVVDASDLMPKDGLGSANPFVEVELDGQRQRTATKFKDLNPVWNETLVFNLSDPALLPNLTIDVSVYHDRRNSVSHSSDAGNPRSLGRVRISGVSVAPSPSDVQTLRFPLDKRGFFSNIRGDIALRLYAIPDPFSHLRPPPPPPPLKQLPSFSTLIPPLLPLKKRRRLSQLPPCRRPQPPMSHESSSPFLPRRHRVIVPHNLLWSRVGYRGRDKISSTYDLVLPIQFLYVSVVKAGDLPAMDITGSLDPYVEVKLGNYKGITKHLEKTQNPVFNQIFAFSRDCIQANLLEITVKDKDVVKDDFVGRVQLDLSDVPHRADEAFPEAWHSDAHSVGAQNLVHTRSKVYFSPKLCYLRILVIEAQDLVPSDRTRLPDPIIRLQLGHQLRSTRPSPTTRSVNPVWNEEFMFVASEPFDEPLFLTIDNRIDGNKIEPLGQFIFPVLAAPQRTDHSKPIEPRWFNLAKPNSSGGGGDEAEKKKDSKFSSKIHLRIFLDTGYHVLDESTHYSSDLRPTAKNLRKLAIGFLELGILDARNLMPMKAKDGRTTDAYCVAKYGPKWVRTRTLLDTLNPKWHEQYTWEVFDPCTVVTIAVFDNCNLSGNSKEDAKDQRIGKVRIRLSTLEADRVYSHYYSLLALQTSGLKKTGELHLAVRFTCTAWVNMVALYSKPLLPKMHYVQPIPVVQLDLLRHQAMQIVAARLGRAETASPAGDGGVHARRRFPHVEPSPEQGEFLQSHLPPLRHRQHLPVVRQHPQLAKSADHRPRPRALGDPRLLPGADPPDRLPLPVPDRDLELPVPAPAPAAHGHEAVLRRAGPLRRAGRGIRHFSVVEAIGYRQDAVRPTPQRGGAGADCRRRSRNTGRAGAGHSQLEGSPGHGHLHNAVCGDRRLPVHLPHSGDRRDTLPLPPPPPKVPEQDALRPNKKTESQQHDSRISKTSGSSLVEVNWRGSSSRRGLSRPKRTEEKGKTSLVGSTRGIHLRGPLAWYWRFYTVRFERDDPRRELDPLPFTPTVEDPSPSKTEGCCIHPTECGPTETVAFSRANL